MADEIVVVNDDPSKGNSDFAAGVATATATQAEQKSVEASYMAEAANTNANEAADTAVSADIKASDAQYGVDELRGRFDNLETSVSAGFAALAETLNGLKTPSAPQENTAPAPAPKTTRSSDNAGTEGSNSGNSDNSDNSGKSDKKTKPRGFGAWKK
jgi:hypothetical protein